mgnify:CR=1 FL=1
MGDENNQKLKRNAVLGSVIVSISAILWGFDGVVLTPRLYNLNVSFVVFMLHLIPFVLMNLVFFDEYRKLKKFTRSDFIYFFLIALFGGSLGTIAIVKALFLVNFEHLSVIVILQKLQPIFAIILAAILLKERMGKRFILWASLAIVASYFLTFGLHMPKAASDNLLPASLYALLAAFSFGSATVFGKKVLHKFSFRTATFFRFGMTSFIMFFFVLIGGKIGEFSNITRMNWLIFFIIAFTTGGGAIFLYYYGLKRIKASVSTICELFFPLSAILFDYIFNKHILSPVQWVSAAVLVGAIIRISHINAKNNSK